MAGVGPGMSSGRGDGATWRGFVICGMLFGSDSGAVGWLSTESNDPNHVFEVHFSSRVENGLQLANGGSRDASYMVSAPIRGVLMAAAVQVARHCQVRDVFEWGAGDISRWTECELWEAKEWRIGLTTGENGFTFRSSGWSGFGGVCSFSSYHKVGWLKTT